MATSSTSPSSTTYFAGSSQYAAQLQQSITQAVNIASLPLKQLQSQQTTLNGQQSELETVSSTFNSLQAAVDTIQSSTGVGAFSANVSNTTVASASVSSGVMSGDYTLNVISLGSQTNAVSPSGLNTVTDPTAANIDSASSYTLSINGTDYNISNPAGTLSGLAQAITNSSASVQASVVNVGTTSSPDYRLSVQSLNYAPDTVQLSDGSNGNLLSTISTGTNVTYQVNGQPSTPISSNTRSATLSTGLNVQLLATGSTTITVGQSISGIASGLSAFANAYNSITSELNKNRGQSGGALTGDSVIYQLQNALTNLANFTPQSGSVNSLASIGLTFDTSGNLNFDANALSATATTSAGDVLSFIGNSTSGGFLQAASNLITSITDPTTGILAQATGNVTTQLSSIASNITTDQQKVTQIQTNLTAQMAKADATISSLQDQLTQVTDLFAQMQANQLSNAGL